MIPVALDWENRADPVRHLGVTDRLHAGLINMMEYGVRRFSQGDCDALRFDCFGPQEVGFCRKWMAENHANVPFFTSRIGFGDEDAR